jgi:hypothetical protein
VDTGLAPRLAVEAGRLRGGGASVSALAEPALLRKLPVEW